MMSASLSTECSTHSLDCNESLATSSRVNVSHVLSCKHVCGDTCIRNKMGNKENNRGKVCECDNEFRWKAETDNSILLEDCATEQDIVAQVLEPLKEEIKPMDESSIGFSSKDVLNSDGSVALQTLAVAQKSMMLNYPCANLRANTDFIQDRAVKTGATTHLVYPYTNEGNSYWSNTSVENSTPIMAQVPYSEDFTVESFESMTMFDNSFVQLEELNKKLSQKLVKVENTRQNLANDTKLMHMREEYSQFHEEQLRRINKYFKNVVNRIEHRRSEMIGRLIPKTELDESVKQCMGKLNELCQEMERYIEVSGRILSTMTISESAKTNLIKQLEYLNGIDDTIWYKYPVIPKEPDNFKYDWLKTFEENTELSSSCGGSVMVKIPENLTIDNRNTGPIPLQAVCHLNNEYIPLVVETAVPNSRQQTRFDYQITALNNSYQRIMPNVSQDMTPMSICTTTRGMENIRGKQRNSQTVVAQNESVLYGMSIQNWNLVKAGVEIKDVVVSHVVSPGEFYVLFDYAQDVWRKFQDVLKANVVQKATSDFYGLKKEMVYIIFKDNGWHRVQCVDSTIRDFANDKKKLMKRVFFIDWGKTDSVNRNKLRVPPALMKTFPRMAQLCLLNNCYPAKSTSRKWKDEAVKMFRELTLDKSFTMKVEDTNNSKYKVSLKQNDGQLISEIMADKGFSKKTFKEWKMPLMKKIEYFYNDYVVNEWVDVILLHIDSPALFYVQRNPSKTVENTFEHLTQELTDFFNVGKNRDATGVSNPPVGSAVAAKYSKDGNWYRAEIVSVKENQSYHVRYVDFGNSEIVPIIRIRALPEQFTRLDVGVTKCALQNVRPLHQRWSVESTKFFTDLVRHKLLKMVVCEKNVNRSLVVDLYDQSDNANVLCISKVLVENGKAKGVGELSSIKLMKQQIVDEKKEKNESTASNSNITELKKDSVKEEENASIEYSSEIDDVESVTTKMPSNRENMHPVVIISCDRPSKLCFKLKKASDINKRLSEAMKAFYSNEKNLEESTIEEVLESMKCAVFFEHEWHRGVILKIIEDNQVEVKLCDIGDTASVNLKDIRKIGEKFTKTMNNALYASLAGFEINEEWSADLENIVKDEMQKYEEYCVVFQGNATVDLWGKMDVCNGALDPAIEEWTNINKKLLQVEQSKKCDPVHPILVEHVIALDKEVGLLDPSDNIKEWLDSQVNSAESAIEYEGDDYNCSSPSTESKPVEKSYEPTLFDYGNGDNVDKVQSESISGIDEENTDWLEPEPLTSTHFTGLLTYVDDDCNFYVQTGQSNGKLGLICNGLDSLYGNSHPSPNDLHWKPGEICVAWYYLDNRWYRGRVLKVDQQDGKVVVEYVDYGNVELVKPSNLRKKISFIKIPVQCYKISIRSDCVSTCGDGKWPTSVLDFVHKSVVEKMCEIFVRREEGENLYTMEKLIVPEGYDLFDLLYQLNHAVFTSSIEENKSSCYKDRPSNNSDFDKKLSTLAYKKTCEEADEDVSSDSSISAIETMSIDTQNSVNFSKLRQMSNNNEQRVSEFHVPENLETVQVEVTEILNAKEIVINFISCNTDASVQENRNIFVKMCEELQIEAETQPLVSPPFRGRVCCAKFDDGMWYRAYLLDMLSDDKTMVSVYYIDFGNVSAVQVSELHELKTSWYHVPAQGIKCTLDNVKLVGKKSDILKIGKKLSKILMNKELNATIRFESSKNKYFISLKDDDGTEPYRRLFNTC